MSSQNYQVFETQKGRPVKAWINGVPLEAQAKAQLLNTAAMPFIYKHIAVMPDVHLGKGSTVGSVIPTMKAIIPAAVGVDIGCGMIAIKTDLKADQLPDNLAKIRQAIEEVVPVGFSFYSDEDLTGNHPGKLPNRALWKGLSVGYEKLTSKYKFLDDLASKPRLQLGTLGGGNHFIEVLYDEDSFVWLMIHSGSRGVGNKIGSFFIELARKDMETHFINLPDRDLAYLSEGTQHFQDYLEALSWGQAYAQANRNVMMETLRAKLSTLLPTFNCEAKAINCHHNYVSKEEHFGQEVYITRKGAVSAKLGEWGIIPGSMGTGSFIVQGKGNPDSFHSCSHGAGRVMSRSKAKELITLEDHALATQGVECRKDQGILDESPAAYKDLDAVMAAQDDLIEIKHRLRPLICIKG